MAIQTSWRLPSSSLSSSKKSSVDRDFVRNWEDRFEREQAPEVVITKDFLRKVSNGALGMMPDWTSLAEINLNLGSMNGRIQEVGELGILLPRLVSINLSFNALKCFDGTCFVTLCDLNLAENSIHEIIGLEHLNKLERLNLSGNLLDRLPSSISLLNRLTTLRIKRNNLRVEEDILLLAALELKSLSIAANPWNQQRAVELATSVLSLSDLDGQGIEEIGQPISISEQDDRQKDTDPAIEAQNDSQVDRDAELSQLRVRIEQTESQVKQLDKEDADEDETLLRRSIPTPPPAQSQFNNPPSAQLVRASQFATRSPVEPTQSSSETGGRGERGWLRAENSELRTMCSELKTELETQTHTAALTEKKFQEKFQGLAQMLEEAEGRASLGHETSIALDEELRRTQRLLAEEENKLISLQEQVELEKSDQAAHEVVKEKSIFNALSKMVNSLNVESSSQVVESIATIIAVELSAMKRDDNSTSSSSLSAPPHVFQLGKTSPDWAVEAALRVTCRLLGTLSTSHSSLFPHYYNDMAEWCQKLNCGLTAGEFASSVRSGLTSLSKLSSIDEDLKRAQASLVETEMKVERTSSRLNALQASCDDTAQRCLSLTNQEDRLKLGMSTFSAKYEEMEKIAQESERSCHEDVTRLRAELNSAKEQCIVQEKKRTACEDAATRAKQALQDLFERCERAKKEVMEVESKLCSERAELDMLRSTTEVALSEARSGLASANGEKRVAEEMLASLRRETLEFDRTRSSVKRAEAEERADASRKIDSLNLQIHDKEAKLQRLVRELVTQQEDLKSKEIQFKDRLASAEVLNKRQCEEMKEEALSNCRNKEAEFVKLSDKCKSAEQELALLKLRAKEEEESCSLKRGQMEGHMAELADKVAAAEQQCEFAKRTASRVLKVTEERQAVASELAHRITTCRLAAREAEQSQHEAEAMVNEAQELAKDAEARKTKTLQEMAACRENADNIKAKLLSIESRVGEEEIRLSELQMKNEQATAHEASLREKTEALEDKAKQVQHDRNKLLREVEAYKDQLVRYEREVADYNSESERSKHKTIEITERMLEAESKLLEFESRAAEVGRQTKQAERRLGELKEEEAESTSLLKEMNKKCEVREQQYVTLEKRALEAQTIINASTSQTSSAERSLVALKNQQASLAEKLDELRKARNEEESFLSSTRAELHTLQLSRDELMAEVKRLRLSIVELKENEHQLKQELRLAKESTEEARQTAQEANRRAEEAVKLEATSSARAVAEGRRLRIIEAEIASSSKQIIHSSALSSSSPSLHDVGTTVSVQNSRFSKMSESPVKKKAGRSALADLAEEVQQLSIKLQTKSPLDKLT